jgi:hypothetical protein
MVSVGWSAAYGFAIARLASMAASAVDLSGLSTTFTAASSLGALRRKTAPRQGLKYVSLVLK